MAFGDTATLAGGIGSGLAKYLPDSASSSLDSGISLARQFGIQLPGQAQAPANPNVSTLAAAPPSALQPVSPGILARLSAFAKSKPTLVVGLVVIAAAAFYLHKRHGR